MGIDFDDEIKALLILSSLPESWDVTITIVSSSARGEKLRFDDVQNLVLGEEMHKKKKSVSTNAILIMENREKGGGSSGGSQSRGMLRCFHCGMEGHNKRDCLDLKKY